jgi:hypothetical protein
MAESVAASAAKRKLSRCPCVMPLNTHYMLQAQDQKFSTKIIGG